MLAEQDAPSANCGVRARADAPRWRPGWPTSARRKDDSVVSRCKPRFGSPRSARALRRRPISYVRRGWLLPAAVLDRTCDLRCCRPRRSAPWSVISNDSARSETPRSRGGRERAARPRPRAPATKRTARHHRYCAADLAASSSPSLGSRLFHARRWTGASRIS